MNPDVDVYVDGLEQWQQETQQLRRILLGCNLVEERKWYKPCYTHDGGNIVLIQGFKAYCALLFFRGSLLSDPAGLLFKVGPNTRVGRQLRFTSLDEIVDRTSIIEDYVAEGIELERSGVEVELDDDDFEYPEELQRKLDELPDFRAAFDALTPGRRRGYNLHFSGAKQSATRAARVEKCIPRILDGKGLNDR